MEKADEFFDVKVLLMFNDSLKGSEAIKAIILEDDRNGGI